MAVATLILGKLFDAFRLSTHCCSSQAYLVVIQSIYEVFFWFYWVSIVSNSLRLVTTNAEGVRTTVDYGTSNPLRECPPHLKTKTSKAFSVLNFFSLQIQLNTVFRLPLGFRLL